MPVQSLQQAVQAVHCASTNPWRGEHFHSVNKTDSVTATMQHDRVRPSDSMTTTGPVVQQGT